MKREKKNRKQNQNQVKKRTCIGVRQHSSGRVHTPIHMRFSVSKIVFELIMLELVLLVSCTEDGWALVAQRMDGH